MTTWGLLFSKRWSQPGNYNCYGGHETMNYFTSSHDRFLTRYLTRYVTSSLKSNLTRYVMSCLTSYVTSYLTRYLTSYLASNSSYWKLVLKMLPLASGVAQHFQHLSHSFLQNEPALSRQISCLFFPSISQSIFSFFHFHPHKHAALYKCSKLTHFVKRNFFILILQ